MELTTRYHCPSLPIHERMRLRVATRCVIVPWIVVCCAVSVSAGEATRSALTLEDIPFNGNQAFAYLEQLCDIGPRPSGSSGMERQQRLLTEHFTQLGGNVTAQRFSTRHPLDGKRVPMANLVIQWHPESKERILLCAHYDTRPRPDNEPNPRTRRHGRFIGANDGASGTALLMEMARHMPTLESKYGVDFVLFDGEELVFGDGVRERQQGRYFLGSEWFARQYAQRPREVTYRWGVLLDMVGDADLQIYQERNGMRWKDTRPLVRQIWATAARLGVREFIARPKYDVRDDHIPLHNIGRIPTCDIIDFDYPVHPQNRYWHTEADTPDKCSALSLAKVGWVVLEWVKTTE